MPEQTELTVDDGTKMNAYIARPRGASRRGVLVLQEAFGVNAHIRDVAERLAREGYLAVAPDLFHRTAPGFEGDYNDFTTAMPHVRSLSGAELDADLRAAHAWLQAAGCDSVAAVGFCMGGRTAVRAAAAVPLRAAASFYGSGIPALKKEIPNIGCRLLLLWGDDDQHIPPEQRRLVKDALREAGKPFVECTFSGAGHGFFCDQRSSYHAFSAKLAWTLLLPFLAE